MFVLGFRSKFVLDLNLNYTKNYFYYIIVLSYPSFQLFVRVKAMSHQAVFKILFFSFLFFYFLDQKVEQPHVHSEVTHLLCNL